MAKFHACFLLTLLILGAHFSLSLSADQNQGYWTLSNGNGKVMGRRVMNEEDCKPTPCAVGGGTCYCCQSMPPPKLCWDDKGTCEADCSDKFKLPAFH